MTIARTTDRHVSLTVSALAAAIVATASAVAVLIVARSEIAFVGVPVATFLGARLAPRLDTSSLWPDRPVLLMAFWCMVLGAFGVAMVFSPESAPMVGTIGIVLFGLPAFIFLSIPSLLWAALAVWMTRHADSRGPRLPVS